MAQASFRQRLEWDEQSGEIRDGPVRYLLIRPDTLMGLFTRLSPAECQRALAAFTDATAVFGQMSAERYRTMGAADAQSLLRTIEVTAPQLGWGLWSFENRDETMAEQTIVLTVENSPFAAGYGASAIPVCAPITGMFQALAGLALGAPADAKELSCKAAGHLACRFEARAAAPVRSPT